MTPAAAARVIEAAVETEWDDATPIAYPNVPFTPPGAGNWLKLDFLWGSGQLLTKDGINSIVGVLQLAVFGPKDGGDGELDTAAETARAIVNRVRMASPNTEVIFGAASGPVKQFEESWRSVIVSVPFQVLETVT